MALTESIEYDKIEVVTKYKSVQVRKATVIKKDDVELTRSFHRHVLSPFVSSKGDDNSWTHTPTDISGEAANVQAIANAAWTDDVKAAYKTFTESQTNP